MATLGTIRGASLIEKKSLIQNNLYFVQMRTFLDINYLPIALRQIASLSSSWRLESPWYRWSIIGQTDHQLKSLAREESQDLAPKLKEQEKFQHKTSRHSSTEAAQEQEQ